VFAGQYLGVTLIADDIWLVGYMDYDSGFFDKDVNRIEPVGENPFAPKVSYERGCQGHFLSSQGRGVFFSLIHPAMFVNCTLPILHRIVLAQRIHDK
jgi:hypothetical protein